MLRFWLTLDVDGSVPKGEGMQDRITVHVSVVPPYFVSLLCSGAWFHNSCKQR